MWSSPSGHILVSDGTDEVSFYHQVKMLDGERNKLGSEVVELQERVARDEQKEVESATGELWPETEGALGHSTAGTSPVQFLLETLIHPNTIFTTHFRF